MQIFSVMMQICSALFHCKTPPTVLISITHNTDLGFLLLMGIAPARLNPADPRQRRQPAVNLPSLA